MRAFLIISNEALIHSFIFLLHALDPKHAIFQSKRLSILEPRDGLDRVALDGASEGRRSSEVDGLRARFDLRVQRCSDSQNSLYAFAADGIVDDAKIFTGILDSCFTDDQSAANLTYALIQLDRLTSRRTLDEFVPSETRR